MPLLADRVKESTSTTGTGTLTLLGAYEGYQTFSNAFGSGVAVYYAIAGGDEWEVGIGTTGAGTLTRSTVLASSNGGALVPLSAGVKDVFCTYAAGRAVTTSDAATLTNKTIDDYSNFVGANQLHFKIKANENIVRGNVLKIVGYNAGEQAVEVLKVSSASDVALGLSDDTLTIGQFGTCINKGELYDINTNGFSVGAILYPNTSGGLTSTKPVSGTYQAVALVLRSQLNNGVLLIDASAPLTVETSSNVGNTVVTRDASGNFSAGTITASLSGNASSATTATTATTATNVAWSGITSKPTTLSGFGITDGVSTSGSYANPSWLTSLAWSKITSTPTTLSGYGITDGVSTSGSYSNPSWITALAGSKISGNITGNAANVTGTVAIANGGTGATDAATARSNLSVPSTTGSGASGTWGISISGNAATATSATTAASATTASQIDGVEFVNTGSNSGTAADSINANGISYVTGNIALFGQTDGALYSQAYSSSWQHQIYGDYRTGQIATRGKNNGTWQAWRTQLDSSNYNSYAPTLTGGSASGTWGINITGNAATITSQANSATINASQGVNGNDIVRRSAEGYIYANHVNFNTGVENPTIANFITDNGDGWSRKSSLAHVKNQIRGIADGTWGINVTGSAGSASSASSLSLGSGVINNAAWAGGGAYAGYTYSGGNYRFGFSSTAGVVDVYADGNFYATDSSHLVLHTGNYSSYALPLSGGTMSGSITFASQNYFRYDNGGYSGSTSGAGLQAYATGGNAAYMAFHRAGSYAVNMGLDADNVMRIGGWSASANRWQLDMSGNQTIAGTSYAYGYRGTGNIGGTGEASWHPAGIYSGGTSWLYGTVYLANNALYGASYLRLNNGFQLEQGSGSYASITNWVYLQGIHGLYTGTNGAHFYPNDGSYGSWRITGSRNGWGGIEFGNGGNGAVSLMIGGASSESGFHNNSYGWQLYFSNGGTYAGTGTYGGSATRVLQENVWIGDKYFGSDGNLYSAYTRSYGFLDRDEPSSFYMYPNNGTRLYQLTTTGRHYFEGQDQNEDGSNSAQICFTAGGGMTIGSIQTTFATGFVGSSYPDNRATGMTLTYNKNLNVIQAVNEYYSDERLKRKTGTLDGALNVVKSWVPFRYMDNDVANSFGFANPEEQIGLSAQEIQATFPQLVTLAPFDVDTDFSDEQNPRQFSKSGENYLTLNYDRLVPVLVQAIKELEARVAQLES